MWRVRGRGKRRRAILDRCGELEKVIPSRVEGRAKLEKAGESWIAEGLERDVKKSGLALEAVNSQ